MDAADRRFEVAVFNREVRDLLAEGRKHRHLKDDWADIHYIEVTAESEASARSRIASRYPARAGYVIDGVRLVDP